MWLTWLSFPGVWQVWGRGRGGAGALVLGAGGVQSVCLVRGAAAGGSALPAGGGAGRGAAIPERCPPLARPCGSAVGE